MDEDKKAALRQRFERFLRVTPGCWFIGARKSAYPNMSVDGKCWCMSRIAYELYVGPTENIIKRGVKAICHHCDNPRCVNPDHLFIGTYYENMADMKRKGRSRHPIGTAVFGAKLDDEKVRSILSDRRTQKQIAQDYGVDPSVISDVKTRKIWRHVHV